MNNIFLVLVLFAVTESVKAAAGGKAGNKTGFFPASIFMVRWNCLSTLLNTSASPQPDKGIDCCKIVYTFISVSLFYYNPRYHLSKTKECLRPRLDLVSTGIAENLEKSRHKFK